MIPQPHSAFRQPMHTVYGGAHLFKRTTIRRLGELALGSLYDYGPSPTVFAKALGMPSKVAKTVRTRVEEKLGREPVEDYRIDFEDGFGIRSEADEDTAAERTAIETAEAIAEGTL